MNFTKTALLTLFHPIVAFESIKRDRDSFDYWGPLMIFLLVVAAKATALNGTHFPLSNASVRHTSLFYETVVFFAPILTWVIASYAITTILDGESLFRESLSAALFALTPYVVVTLPVTLLSFVFEHSQAGLFTFFQTAMWIWIITLFVVSIKVMNHYSVGRTIFIVLVSLFTMLIIWATFALFMAISAQFINFVGEVFVELKLLFE